MACDGYTTVKTPEGVAQCCGFKECHDLECQNKTHTISITGKEYACCGTKDCYKKYCDDYVTNGEDVCCGFDDCYNIPDKLYLGDFNTRYVGYYSQDKKTAFLTGVAGGGTPYFYILGFGEPLLNKRITVEIDQGVFGFTKKDFWVKKYSGQSYYNLDGTYLGNSVIGIDIYHGRIPKGKYNLKIIYNNGYTDIVNEYIIERL